MQNMFLLAALLLGASQPLPAEELLQLDQRIEFGRELLFQVGDDATALVLSQSSAESTAAIAGLEASRDQGAANAAHELGFIYLAGRFGIVPDIGQSQRNYELAVAQELHPAAVEYGLMLYHGRHFSKDVDRGLELLNRAAELGNRTAIAFLIHTLRETKEHHDAGRANAWFQSMGMRDDEFVPGIDGDPTLRAQDHALGQAGIYAMYREGVILAGSEAHAESWFYRIEPEHLAIALDSTASFLSSGSHARSDQHLANALQEIAMANNDGDNPTVINNYAWLLATARSEDIRDGVQAAQIMQELFERIEPQGFMIDTLAAAYAESGDFDAAIAAQERANAWYADAEQEFTPGDEHLAAYNEGRAWRE